MGEKPKNPVQHVVGGLGISGKIEQSPIWDRDDFKRLSNLPPAQRTFKEQWKLKHRIQKAWALSKNERTQHRDKKRAKVIREVSVRGVRGSQYCRILDDEGLPTPKSW